MDAKKSSKTPRISLKRNFAQALTDDEVRTQLVDREAAVKKKKEEQVLRKANLDAKKQADKEKKEAAQKERDLKRIRAEREKSEKALQRASQIRNISPHGDAILKKLKIWLNACIILLLLLYLTGVNFSANLELKGKILA
jgi:hypothetical protein